MNVYLGGIHMESNSFCVIPATINTFKEDIWVEGKELESLRGSQVRLGGVYEYFDTQSDIEVIPGFYTQAQSSGKIKKEDFEHMTNQLFESLKNAGKIDGVLLDLHGSMESEAIQDCEGYIVEKTREIVGDQIPIVVALDLHACITEQMMRNIDGFAGYMTIPHTDQAKTGNRAARCLKSLMHNRITPRKFYTRVPVIMPLQNFFFTDKNGPATWLLEKYNELILMPGVISAGLFVTQPWMDLPGLGCEVCVFFEDELLRSKYEAFADDMLRYIWDNRVLFSPEMPSLEEAIESVRGKERPCVIADYGDIPSAGSTGDSTVALRTLLKVKLDEPSCFAIVDSKTVERSIEVGEGNTGLFRIGGTDVQGCFNSRVEIEAKVIKIVPGKFPQLGPALKGELMNPGIRVWLQVGNINIVVCKLKCMCHDANTFITMGLNPADMGIIIIKMGFVSAQLCYKNIGRLFVFADSPGLSSSDLRSFPFKNVKRPVYPLDDLEGVPYENVKELHRF